MENTKINLNKEVTKFLEDLNHPFEKEIQALRIEILSAQDGLTENIKWNGPNYSFNGEDRITMRIHPPKQIQLIFHRGAKKQAELKNKLIDDKSGLLIWKENDRAIATFKNMEEITTRKSDLTKVVKEWIGATTLS